MLHEFLTANQSELVDRCREKVARRSPPKANSPELKHGIALFLEQLIRTLEVEQGAQPLLSRKVSGPSGGAAPDNSEIGVTAARHGRELLQQGYTVNQVVHDYGDLCQAVTELALERDAPIDADEFQTLNRCLDNGIADAVTEFSYQRDILVKDQGAHALNERLGFLAHELRNLIQTATLAVTAIKSGNVGLAGATGAVLDRSLIGLRTLIDRSLSDVRVTAGLPARYELLPLAHFIAEIKISALLEAHARGCRLIVNEVDPTLAVDADRELLFSAVGNLLQNAFKFTGRHTEVVLSAYASAGRVLIEVSDHCGGLPPGDAERMFLPFMQGAADRSGLGLGLSISRRSVEANNGMLSVRDVPGTGCVFTIDLPRHSLPEPIAVTRDPPARHAGAPEKMARILVVDDNDDNRYNLAGFLERDGYEVGVAAEGEGALKAQEAAPYDVLITDIFMPDKDGVETIREFRTKYPTTRIIAMSGARGIKVDYLALSLELGAHKILRKPFDVGALKTAVIEVLASR
ncbi:MAG TPA: response regulator [Burkholderiales bacterium]|nr:response regulator [Burkholderiales bacterium]